MTALLPTVSLGSWGQRLNPTQYLDEETWVKFHQYTGISGFARQSWLLGFYVSSQEGVAIHVMQTQDETQDWKTPCRDQPSTGPGYGWAQQILPISESFSV